MAIGGVIAAIYASASAYVVYFWVSYQEECFPTTLNTTIWQTYANDSVPSESSYIWEFYTKYGNCTLQPRLTSDPLSLDFCSEHLVIPTSPLNLSAPQEFLCNVELKYLLETPPFRDSYASSIFHLAELVWGFLLTAYASVAARLFSEGYMQYWKEQGRRWKEIYLNVRILPCNAQSHPKGLWLSSGPYMLFSTFSMLCSQPQRCLPLLA